MLLKINILSLLSIRCVVPTELKGYLLMCYPVNKFISYNMNRAYGSLKLVLHMRYLHIIRA